jgi:hypothetical protein
LVKKKLPRKTWHYFLLRYLIKQKGVDKRKIWLLFLTDYISPKCGYNTA